jgi:type VI protein secretion system component VasF
MKQLTINVDGWPDRMVRMVEQLIDTLAHQLRIKRDDRPPPELPRWPGVALPPEKLRRVEIYRDAS